MRYVQCHSRVILLIESRVQDELLQELADLEQETLDERLSGADTVPTAEPVKTKSFTVEEDDEEEQLRQLQASLAM